MGTTISTSTSSYVLTDPTQNPVTVTSSGRVNGEIYGIYAYGTGTNSWTVTNAGVIIGGGGGSGIQIGSGKNQVSTAIITNQFGGTIAGDGSGIGIYNDATATVINESGATILATSLPGVLLNGFGTVANTGVIDSNQDGAQLRGGGVLINNAGGTITAAGIGVRLYASGTVTNAGTIHADGGQLAVRLLNGTTSRLIVDPGAVFVGGAYGSGNNGVLDLASAGSVGTLTTTGFTNFGTIEFDPSSQWLLAGAIGALADTIQGFSTTDTIDLTGFVATGKSFGSDALVLTSAGPSVTLHIQGSFTTGDFQTFSDTHGGTFIINTACYAAGTRILTPTGEVPIEQLAIGDFVVTHSGEARPIKWVGRRSYAGRFLAGNRAVLPIRFAANSLADGIPQRDLDVSPKHAMFIDDVLVPAELLVNGVSILQLQDIDSIEYVHLELASHDVILAEGALSETFVDCDSRGMFHNAADYTARYPGDPGPSWQFCAPRLEPASEPLVAILDRLGQRAGVARGFGPPEALLGNIERCDRVGMTGWAFDPTRPRQRVRLEILCDGERVGHVVADRHRPDLERAGYLGDGHCAFHFTYPIRTNPLSSHVIELRRAADGAQMPGSPLLLPSASTFDAACRADFALLLRDVAQSATQASELDAIAADLMTQVEALLAARARLEAGDRADATNLRDRWGGLVPTAAARRSAPELRPQALFVDDHFPAAGASGGDCAALDHMRALMRIGLDVSFVAPRDLSDGHDRAAALAAIGIRPLLAPWYGSVEEILHRHAGRMEVVYLHRAENAAAYGKLVRQYCPRAQLVYGVADLHHLRLARQGAVEDRPEVSRHAMRLRVEEFMAAQLADVVITHSNTEAALLRSQIPGVAVVVVPWSVPVRRPCTTFQDRNGIAFVGHFGHEPNIDAVHWLAQDILPLVRRQDPAIGFRIVGNGMTEGLRRLARPGLELVGHVDRLDAVLAESRLTVAPLRYGAGLKAKVLESLAAGVPCIGTSIAFEGMALPPVLAACVGDTPEALADCLVRLHHDETAHAAVAAAGQRHALVNYSETCVDALMRQALAPALRRWAVTDCTATSEAAA